MRTIVIESVQNGLLVRPFSPCSSWASNETDIYVYKTIAELQRDIPLLMDVDGIAQFGKRFFTNTKSGGIACIEGRLTPEQNEYINSGLWRQLSVDEVANWEYGKGPYAPSSSAEAHKTRTEKAISEIGKPL